MAESFESSNVLNGTFTFSGQTRTFTLYFNGTDGLVQTRLVDLDSFLSSTLFVSESTIWMKSGIAFCFEPLDLIPDRDVLGWMDTNWSFGDGTFGVTEDRIMLKAYSATGDAGVSATVTYEEGVQASVQQAVHVF